MDAAVPGTEEVERELRRRFDARDFDGTLELAITRYGPELLGFLNGLAREPGRADDAFGAACERMWKHLATFRWQSTFRVWAYTIARNELMRTLREPAGRPAVPVSQIASAIEQVRVSTPMYKRTEVKDRFAALREELDPDDHALLGLRIDRGMAWADIAAVLGAETPDAIKRDAAALRKRFERLKTELRDRLREA